MDVSPPASRAETPTDLEPQPRLVLRFALYAGAVLLAAGLAIAWLVNREVASRAERTVAQQAQTAVARNLDANLRRTDFGGPVSPARRGALDALFRKNILIPAVVGGRLVGRDGTVTYAADHALIGSRVARPAALRQALAGSVSRRIAHVDTWRGEKGLKVLRVVVPVRLAGQRSAIGAVELDQDYRAVTVSIGDARERVALILGLALLALYLALFPILQRVTRQLAARNRRLHEHAAERERLLGAERAARAEAESAQRLLAEQNDRLRELDGLKDDFVSLVSHELRTPLTSIRGYVELLLEENDLDEQQRRFLGVVERNSERLLALVADLLFLAQVDAGRLTFDVAPVDLHEVAAECVESALPAAVAKAVELELHVEDVPRLDGDRARLAQVLENLVSNAIKFTPRGGRVDVRLATAGEHALLEVRDTGVGLPPDEHDRLFERFFRSARATADAIPGTGLGLSIAKAIVERHGGRISVESAVDVGTTVSVELPLTRRSALRPRHELAA